MEHNVRSVQRACQLNSLAYSKLRLRPFQPTPVRCSRRQSEAPCCIHTSTRRLRARSPSPCAVTRQTTDAFEGNVVTLCRIAMSNNLDLSRMSSALKSVMRASRSTASTYSTYVQPFAGAHSERRWRSAFSRVSSSLTTAMTNTSSPRRRSGVAESYHRPGDRVAISFLPRVAHFVGLTFVASAASRLWVPKPVRHAACGVSSEPFGVLSHTAR